MPGGGGAEDISRDKFFMAPHFFQIIFHGSGHHLPILSRPVVG